MHEMCPKSFERRTKCESLANFKTQGYRRRNLPSPAINGSVPFRDMKSSSSRLFASNIEYGTRCWTSISTTRLHGTQPYVIQPIQMIKLTTNMIIIINGNNQYLVYACLSNLDEVSLYISGSSSHYVKIVSISQKLLFFC